jgi:NADH:ubiquinone oxidoreductase subunit F (NADH-binding)
VLLGGYGGTWMRWEAVESVGLDEESLRAVGAGLGAGVIAPIPPAACGVAETARVVAYLAGSSARQCGPCVFGLESLAVRMEKLRVGKARRTVLKGIADDLRLVRGRGACHHPDGATRLIASALDAFAADVEQHAQGRPCAQARKQFLPVPEVGR